MGEALPFRQEDGAGLAVAAVLHVAVVGLIVYAAAPPELIEMPLRVSVNLASEVSLESTAPRIAPDSQAAIAPELADTPPVLADEEAPEEASPQEDTPPPPPDARNAVQQESPPRDRPRERPDRQREQTPKAAAKKGGGSLTDSDDFVKGLGDSPDSENTGAPATALGPRETAALEAAVVRQLKPRWKAPVGVDADKLRSVVTWKLNPDGSLIGNPRCRTLRGSITASNRPQAGLHCERAIRAVRGAAPFRLPERFYGSWKELEWEFNRRL